MLFYPKLLPCNFICDVISGLVYTLLCFTQYTFFFVLHPYRCTFLQTLLRIEHSIIRKIFLILCKFEVKRAYCIAFWVRQVKTRIQSWAKMSTARILIQISDGNKFKVERKWVLRKFYQESVGCKNSKLSENDYYANSNTNQELDCQNNINVLARTFLGFNDDTQVHTYFSVSWNIQVHLLA